MSYVTRTLVLLTVGLFMFSALASADDRLTVSGSLTNFLHSVSNLSGFDDNFTNLVIDQPAGNPQPGDQDDFILGSMRLGLNFNVEAFENTKLVVGTLVDQFWGENGGIGRNGWRPDNYNESAIRLTGLYVDVAIPGTAATLRAGGFGAGAQRLKGCMIHCMDTAGVAITAPFSDTVNTYTWYSHWSDTWDGVFGASATTGAGETWAGGTRIELAPLEGLDLDLIYVYQRVDCLAPTVGCNFRTMQLRNAAADDGDMALSYVAEEDRNWAGIDMRYQYGDFTLSPTAIFHFGSTDLVGGGQSDISSFLIDVEASYQANPSLLLKGRVGFTPGDSASEDLGDGSTLNSWQIVGTYVLQPSLSWFSLWGYRNIIIYPLMFDYSSGRATDARMSFDQFGLMVFAARAEYTINERTLITGSLGIINTAEDVGRPARLGTDRSVNPSFNYTGQDTHLATEVDVELVYTLNGATDLKLWAAYSMNGDALNLQMEAGGPIAASQDTVGGGANLIYSF